MLNVSDGTRRVTEETFCKGRSYSCPNSILQVTKERRFGLAQHEPSHDQCLKAYNVVVDIKHISEQFLTEEYSKIYLSRNNWGVWVVGRCLNNIAYLHSK